MASAISKPKWHLTKVISGESAPGQKDVLSDWLRMVLQELLKNYLSRDK